MLWAYDWDGHGIHIDDPEGKLTAYTRGPGSPLSFNFCRTCGNVVSWRGLKPDADGRTRIAVNLRLAEPEAVADVPLQCFDGRHSFDDLPRDGRRVRDVWFSVELPRRLVILLAPLRRTDAVPAAGGRKFSGCFVEFRFGRSLCQ